MTKGISIKKNVKPKKIVPKKPASKNKTTAKRNVVQNKPSKEGHSQEQSIIFNIGTNTPKKRSAPIRKPVKPAQSISQPIIQSFNQPIFKPPIPQQSSLASSILATQSTPKVVAEEAKEQTTIRKALQDQHTQTDETVSKVNDLERVRGERIKRFDKPVETVETVSEMKKEEPIRHALLGQLLAEPQDDTEEIQALTRSKISAQPDIPFVSSEPSFLSPRVQPSKYVNALRGIGLSSLGPTNELLSKREQRSKLLESLRRQPEEPIITETFTGPIENIVKRSKEVSQEQAEEPPEEVTKEEEVEVPLKQPEPRQAAEMVTQTETIEPSQPLTQASDELGFGGLTEEVQTSVGQILPPQPVSQEQLLRNQQQVVPPSLLGVRAPDEYITQQLVKDEPSGGAPLAESTIIEPKPKVSSESKQIELKWQELKDAGLISTLRTRGGASGDRKTKQELLNEIHSVSGNENWTYIPRPNKSGPKKKAVVAEAVEVTEV